MTQQPLTPPPTALAAFVRAVVARVSPREYLKGIVVEAIQEERYEANLRAVQVELAAAEHMARTTGMSYGEAARLLGLEDEGGPACRG